jgi:hypothetical protein
MYVPKTLLAARKRRIGKAALRWQGALVENEQTGVMLSAAMSKFGVLYEKRIKETVKDRKSVV